VAYKTNHSWGLTLVNPLIAVSNAKAGTVGDWPGVRLAHSGTGVPVFYTFLVQTNSGWKMADDEGLPRLCIAARIQSVHPPGRDLFSRLPSR
jgi:hypothetical protein